MKTLTPITPLLTSLSLVTVLASCGGGGGGDNSSQPSTDTTPAPFTFTDQTMAEVNTDIDSAPITISGINSAAAISITGGEYSIDGQDFTSDAGTINNGQQVVVRLTTGAAMGTAAEATLTVGGVSDTFTVTTPFEVLTTEKLEAESATVLGTAATTEVAEASGGSLVNNIMEDGAGVEFSNVQASISLRLAYSSDASGTLSIMVDGEDAGDFAITATGSASTFATTELDLNIDSGSTVQVVYNTGDVSANIDYVDFIPSPLQITSTVVSNTFTGADGISVAANGDVYISGGPNAKNLRRVTPEGEVSVVATGFGSANGSDFDSLGNLYIADYQSNSVRRYTPEGNLETFASNLNGPAGVFVDAQDNIYVSLFGANFSASGSTVLRFNLAGEQETYASGGGLADVIGVVGDESGEIYATNWQSGQVYRVTDGNVELIADISSNINMIDYSRGKIYIAHGSRVYTVDTASGESAILSGSNVRGTVDGHIAEAQYNFLAGSAFTEEGDILYLLDNTTGDLRKISIGED